MRQNMLFSLLRKQLSKGQDRLLCAMSLYRVPVSNDGLMAVEAVPKNLDANRNRLLDYALLEGAFDPGLETDYFSVPPVVRKLLGNKGFASEELKAIHQAMGRYHRFQGKNVSRVWKDNIEAIYHFREAREHEAADELAEGVCNFYYNRSSFADARKFAAEIVEREEPPAPWWALNRYGLCQDILGFYDSALDAYKRALPVVPTKKDKGATLNNISQIYDTRGDYETALKYLELSLEIKREIGDKSGEGTTLNNISQIYDARGDYETALKYLEQCLEIFREIGDKQHEGGTLNNISQIYDARGDYETALKYLEQSLEIRREIGDKSGEGTTLNNIGQIYDARGDYETALKYLEQSLEIMREIGDKSGEGTTLNNISLIFEARGDYETALKYLELSLDIQREIGDKSGMIATLHNMAHIAKQSEDLEKAVSLWSEALSLAMETKNAMGMYNVGRYFGSLLAQLGNHEEAKKLLSMAVQVGRAAGFPNVQKVEEMLNAEG